MTSTSIIKSISIMPDSQTETEIRELLKSLKKLKINNEQGLERQKHIQYVYSILYNLGEYIVHF